MMSVAAATPSSDGRLTSRCTSLLEVIAATGNLTLDYQLLLDKYIFIKPFKPVLDILYRIIKHRHKLIKYIMYIIKHMFT
jgi:hypothetical protein